jgi:DNA-binding LacI/PurR family transcriptional regulator
MDKRRAANRAKPAIVKNRPRLEDVAARAGVSPASVSLVLNNLPGPSPETRERVVQVAQALGYRPDRTARLLASRRRHLLGVMMDVRNMFHAELVEHVQTAAERVGYDVVLSTLTGTRDEQRAIHTLLDFRCEALILLGPEMKTAELAKLDRQLPVIAIGRRISPPAVDVVRTADNQGVGAAVSYLAELGHRTITFLDGGKGTIASDRRRGYRTAMRRHGLSEYIRILPGNHTEEGGVRAAGVLLNDGEVPSAVIASNDRSAMGVLDAFNRAGVAVPRSVSVIGYDDSPLARLAHVNLTTVSQATREQAEHAVAAAVERLDNGRSAHREIVLTPELVIRGTTGPPAS